MAKVFNTSGSQSQNDPKLVKWTAESEAILRSAIDWSLPIAENDIQQDPGTAGNYPRDSWKQYGWNNDYQYFIRVSNRMICYSTICCSTTEIPIRQDHGLLRTRPIARIAAPDISRRLTPAELSKANRLRIGRSPQNVKFNGFHYPSIDFV